MEERRQFVRLDTRLDIRYSLLREGAQQAAITKDVGGSGICLFAEQELPVGTKLQIAMKIPGRAEAVNFTAEVVWSESYEVIGRGQRQRSVEVGARFIEIAPKDQELIMQHVILGYKQPHAK